MLETIEFRIPESRAARHLPADAGVRLGMARKLEVSIDDPLFDKIRSLSLEFREKGEDFITAWIPHRKYSPRELENADLLRLSARKVFEPAGEECGTIYDDGEACPLCGAGGRQMTPLFLDGKRFPTGVDYAETISGESVVSRRLVDVFLSHHLRGVDFGAVHFADRGGSLSETYHQMLISGSHVRLHGATRVGNDPFDESSGGHCLRGDLAGLNLLSEVWIERSDYRGDDVLATKEFVGTRRGVLRPRPLILVTPRVWLAIRDSKLKGFSVEVAHLS